MAPYMGPDDLLCGVGSHTEFLAPWASLAEMGIIGKQWWKEPSGIQNDCFAVSQRDAELTSCAEPIHVPRLQACWLNCVLIDLGGLHSVRELTQLGKEASFLLSVSWWAHLIILNPLCNNWFQEYTQPQLRLCFLPTSAGYTISMVNMHLVANLTKHPVLHNGLSVEPCVYLKFSSFPLKVFGLTGPVYKISHIHIHGYRIYF